MRDHQLPPGDFPDLNRFREALSQFDCAAFPKLTDAKLAAVEQVLAEDVPRLMRAFDNPF